ncbi:hypothetical protein Angca_000974 [Angiostrongylus cantonensis]|nr:hypothetical protein Angca_000974 [Angiostrongylus cantonensis]
MKTVPSSFRVPVRLSFFNEMDFTDFGNEGPVEFDDENNQLKAELKRLRDTLLRNNEIMNELEEENVELHGKIEKITLGCPKCAILEQTVLGLRSTLEQYTVDSCRMSEEIATLNASLDSARAEIDELRRARTMISPNESTFNISFDSSTMNRLQEERDIAMFELQSAKYQISALELERNDNAERADAFAVEAQELRKQLKELREQLHQIESERMESVVNIGISKRGNSMFAEDSNVISSIFYLLFAEERLKLEADFKLLYSRYLLVSKENCRLYGELDEARLLASRQSGSEVGDGAGRCRCYYTSTELVELRARIQTMDYRLARAQNELIDLAKTRCGTDPLLKSYYRSLKLEMESLRQERNKLRDERNKLMDENASFAARTSKAEKFMEVAKDDIERLKMQLSMLREDGRKKDAAEVSQLVYGTNGSSGAKISAAVSALEWTAASTEDRKVQKPHGFTDEDKRVTKAEPFTPLFPKEKHDSSINPDTETRIEQTRSEVLSKKVKFADADRNNEQGALRSDSMSASELRRIGRKQARSAQSKSKVFSAEPLMKFVAKPLTALEKGYGEDPLSHEVLSSTHASASDKSCFSKEGSLTTGAEDFESSRTLPTTNTGDGEVERNPPSSNFSENGGDFEAHCVSHQIPLDSSKNFNWKTVQDVPEEKENVSSSSCSRNL